MKAFCIQCKRETNHKVLREIKQSYSYDDGFWAQGTWQIIECNGCEAISFREVWENSEATDPEGTSYMDVKLYPNRSEETLPIKPFYNVPIKVRNIYREMIDAFNNEMLILCSGGLRATIEGICNSKGIIDGPIEVEKKGAIVIQRKKDLQGKIVGLFEKGHLTKQHAEILNEHRFLGNEALHTLDQPTKEELKIAIDIVEHTLDNLYELTEKVSDLRLSKRKRTKK